MTSRVLACESAEEAVRGLELGAARTLLSRRKGSRPFVIGDGRRARMQEAGTAAGNEGA